MPIRSKEKQKAYNHQWYLANREKELARSKRYAEEHKEERARIARKNNYQVKIEVLSHYSAGIPRCARCGITNVNVLCIDHIEGGGAQDRVDTRHWGAKLHYYLRRNNYPKGFQVLCANCNMEKFILEGK